MNDDIENVQPEEAVDKKPYKVGTLEYTKMGLVMVFFWLLWGDFCYTMMETVFPTLTPLMMNKLGSSNMLIGLMMTTMPAMFNFVITPWVSFKSDRHRSKRGRRIPFLIYPTPFIGLFLILIGYSPDLGAFLHRGVLGGYGFSRAAVTLGLLAVLVAGFQFFNLFVQSIYGYLFNDVVPHHLLARFFAIYRMVGTAAGTCFSMWIFPVSSTHSKEIFVGAGIFYTVAFTIMCLKVKEGEYPPPPENLDGRQGTISSMKTFFAESFAHKYYLLNFLAATIYAMSGAIGVFGILYRQSLGITDQQIGYIGGFSGIVILVLAYPAGLYSDKKHPLRTMLFSIGGLAIITPLYLIFVFRDFSPLMCYKITFALSMISLPVNSLYAAASGPLSMRMYPLERYGQYCSAESMMRALGYMLGGVLAGKFMDMVKAATIDHGPNYCYRYSPVWTLFFTVAGLALWIVVFKYWKHYGGDKNYMPPAVGRVAQAERETEAAAGVESAI